MHINTLGILTATALFLGATATMAPPAMATASQVVTVDCVAGTATYFTVSPEETIDFRLTGPGCSDFFGRMTPEVFQTQIDQIANVSGTGGSAVDNFAAQSVMYTAGPRAGTDSLTMATPRTLTGSKDLRRLDRGFTYYMTVPAQDPAPWLQEIGRAAGASCPAGWNPSWSMWPNNNTGGFTCVRTQAWDSSQGAWVYRSGR